ncbi:hypothetical protein [Pelagerythrobacter rhizovicinus]|uniref:Uncharacterized protein n=1 Tax=Pelagerythrobacter rhizovicinus TaxID=2268576 RepID=A0A4V1QVW9_9SPHN|nr:hypothetical protein [Pelagerythrobacter rhizovicinus]RXZ64116.1 hypothetical protein ETX26_09305 [Pelagerythrobacter rhizovicinus]
MSGKADRRRGEPLLILVVLMTAWVGTRAMMWEAPLPPTEAVLDRIVRPMLTRGAAPGGASPVEMAATAQAAAEPERHPLAAGPRPIPARQIALLEPLPIWHTREAASTPPASRGEVMASHQLLWLAATAQLPVPPDVAKLLRARAAPPANGAQPPLAVRKADRWAFDAWLLLRPGDTAETIPGGRLASYGASQAGAVVRYRLAPGSPHRPAAYVRATQALAAGKETELAVGIAARPVAAVPISLHSEVRATRQGGGEVELRPAAFAVTELAPVRLPLGLRGEAYAQAGYVGGKFATAFADGQARVERELIRFDLAEVRAGAGLWGGAQKGAARLDVGPTASLNFDMGDAPARLALDYRWRIAGDAVPGRGIAVTLSTGF